MRREVVTDWKNGSEGEDAKKMEGIKRGSLPYVVTFLFPTLVIMNLQTMAGFTYFHFCINMLKWQSSIFEFRQKISITFIIQQPNETYKNVLTICELFSRNIMNLGHFAHDFFFEVQIIFYHVKC
jgi:hypothetical protein